MVRDMWEMVWDGQRVDWAMAICAFLLLIGVVAMVGLIGLFVWSATTKTQTDTGEIARMHTELVCAKTCHTDYDITLLNGHDYEIGEDRYHLLRVGDAVQVTHSGLFTTDVRLVD